MKVKNTLIASVVLGFSLPLWATAPTTDRIAQLKGKILEVANEARSRATFDNEDNLPEVRETLDRLVGELIQIAPKRTQEEMLVQVVGAWKSVWSDLSYFGPQAPLADEIYQIVFPTGYYYNLSNYMVNGSKYGVTIKGIFSVQEPALTIEFVKATRMNRPFPLESDLATLAMRAELGTFDEENDPNNAPGIGFRTSFKQEYVDETLRIGTGQSRGGSTLFILERAQNF